MYVYTGSALSSLEGRIGRHIGKEKKMKWHIDFFLEEAEALGFISIVSSKREECSINSKFLEEGEVLAKGFGSSDCGCPSHLVYLGDQPHFEYPHERHTLHPPSCISGPPQSGHAPTTFVNCNGLSTNLSSVVASGMGSPIASIFIL